MRINTHGKNSRVRRGEWILWDSQFSSVQLLSHIQLFATPWTAACQASLSISNSQSPPKPMSIESVMPSSHLILCRPLLLLPSIFPRIRFFSNESALRIRWPKYWSFSFNISPSNEHQDWSPLGWTGWISSQSNGLSRVFPNTTVQKHLSFAECYSITSSSVLFSSHIFWYISFLQIHSTMQTRWAVSDRFRRNSQSCKREIRCNIFCPSTCYCLCLEYPSPWFLQ